MTFVKKDDSENHQSVGRGDDREDSADAMGGMQDSYSADAASAVGNTTIERNS